MNQYQHHSQRLPAIAALVFATMLAAPARAADEWGGELRQRWDARSANSQGPIAQANALAPGIATAPPSTAVIEAELRGSWRALRANALLWSEHPRGAATASGARLNELYASGDFAAWQASAGKKIVGWDVGYGFRPNDFVQQEARRTMLAQASEGRPLLQLEHFNADTASSLVWVNPQQTNDSDDAQRFALESALAARWYRRAGAADWHGFARLGEHTGGSLGAAFTWVASDTLALHASARALQRHDGWRFDSSAGNSGVTAKPWQVSTLGRTWQGLIGANWTGAQQQSVIIEWWRDGTALPDAHWDGWVARNQALNTLGAQLGALPVTPPGALIGVAGNLAWQAAPFSASNLRRDNLFIRLAWQPDHWSLSLDALFTPADSGRIVTAAVQWQGDRVRLNAAFRVYGGPADALFAQLPQRHIGALSATWSF